ncbi:sigma-54-dependent Fis family transcriptional regulator [Kaustia mangrovi]|uniref:Sigma-54-dependent Fis family transcriptional regulator n=1 Tax=Kaustia mangrovi TaxID=2593653 RepID=A0A7S8C2Y3_9HYPH|nr:sigma-54 dependent transcriptional regulator [Kaustia mangrovi]QPC42395.1 sigma-54-dependent Fis family transcriptional regulator [Kaustia mangrovi]
MAHYQGELIGEHSSIEGVRRLIGRVAASPSRTVLIYGETGTGKGLVARMLHEQSARARNEFVDVNCAAIPSSLLESELFGHERGAFTGASAKKTGLVEAANRGTIFLDEIREMDLMLQAKLLSLLDTQRFRRVGAVRPIEVDVRFIAATNKILLSEVTAGHFREDLYYRLQVIAINIPPLRERGDDVLILAEHFIRKLNARYDRSITGLSGEVESVFKAYPWPGNVRELENLLERIFILEDDNRVLARHLPDRILRTVRAGTARVLPATEGPARTGHGEEYDFRAATAAFQRELIEKALMHAEGSVAAAAQQLGLSRHALRHQMIKLGLRA